MELSLVIPCYNEARSLPELIERVALALDDAALSADQFELVLVDNGSSDGSWEVMIDLSKVESFAFLRPKRVLKNQGYGHGMFEGLKASEGRVVATSHADLQCEPSDVFRAYDLWLERQADSAGAHVMVKGVRSGRPLPAQLVSRLFDVASLLLLQRWLYETNAQPKVFTSELITSLTAPPKDFCFDLYLLLCALREGYQLETIPVEFPPRPYGESHWASSFSGRWGTFARFIRYMAVYRLNGHR